MTRTSVPLALAALVLAAPLQSETPDAASRPFVNWAAEHAVPLPSCDMQTYVSALEGMAAIVGDARVVALGEPAHGAHEPLAFRNCLFRYLVERRDFTAIALETGLAESRALQRHVSGGPGETGPVVRGSMIWGFGRFAENVALIAWIRRYNADPAHVRKLRVYGIDMSGGDRTGDWLGAGTTLDNVATYLERNAPDRSQAARRALADFRDRFTQSRYAALPRGDRMRLRSAITGLIRFLDRDRAALIASSGAEDYAWAQRNAVLAQQLEGLFSVSRAAGNTSEIGPDDYAADAARDAAMADNLRWALEREGPQGRILLFAHNGHVANAATRGGIWSVYRHPPMAMGQHLRKALGDRLVILPIASAAQHGAGLPREPREPGTLDKALAATGTARFAIDLRRGKPAAAARWLARDQTIRVNFTTESILRPSRAFDGVVFFESLSAAERQD